MEAKIKKPITMVCFDRKHEECGGIAMAVSASGKNKPCCCGCHKKEFRK